jgi:NAD(P)-dependent dehydrogenase (short-subunit alcohol dehydrogenase family)
MERLEGRTAIVTGGAKGIGRHYALALARAGARVVVADIADGAEVVAAIAGVHGTSERAVRSQQCRSRMNSSTPALAGIDPGDARAYQRSPRGATSRAPIEESDMRRFVIERGIFADAAMGSCQFDPTATP